MVDNHPNPRLPGAVLAQPKNKKCLEQLFKNASICRIFTETSIFRQLLIAGGISMDKNNYYVSKILYSHRSL